jgi:hypothetical protein
MKQFTLRRGAGALARVGAGAEEPSHSAPLNILEDRLSAKDKANDPQQSWGFEGEPPKAVIKDSGTRDGIS